MGSRHEGTLLRIGAALDAAQGEVLPLPAVHFDVLADALAAQAAPLFS